MSSFYESPPLCCRTSADGIMAWWCESSAGIVFKCWFLSTFCVLALYNAWCWFVAQSSRGEEEEASRADWFNDEDTEVKVRKSEWILEKISSADQSIYFQLATYSQPGGTGGTGSDPSDHKSFTGYTLFTHTTSTQPNITVDCGENPSTHAKSLAWAGTRGKKEPETQTVK